MVQMFNYILNNYLEINDKKVDKTKRYYQVIVKELPNKINKIINDNGFLVTGSVGQGNRTSFPWICIFNKDITSSAQKGIYIGFLFRKDMTGFYLTLTQGVTYFDKNYHSNKYNVMNYSGAIIKDMLNSDYFTDRKIDLRINDKNKDKLGFGYENSTIISKLYLLSDFSETELELDLMRMKEIYNDLYLQFQYEGYDDFIKNIVEEKWLPIYKDDYFDDKMHKEMLKEADIDKASIKEFTIEEVDADNYEKPSLVKKSSTIIRKTDFLKKSIKDMQIGYLGEKTVVQFEKDRLIKLNRPDLAKKVKHVSTSSDSFGYDILSFDLDEKGNEVPRYIEVKSTNSKEDPILYFSENEIMTSEKYKKQYWVYRVIEVNAENRKFYKIKGSIKDNFELKPISYKAIRK
ncbi:DUF3578 domain-containing protein [Mycoplasmatota bacterium]|nr:DUF3578 domain-containing protein [Mycoplasmatota bacterium]